ncbi:MAG: hypothetical protein ACLP0B_02380 [Steroidobacteraceae bacterium]|jgi:hypothetical protein
MASVNSVASSIKAKLQPLNAVEYLAQLLDDSTIDDGSPGTELQRRLMTLFEASQSGGYGASSGMASILHQGGIFSGLHNEGFREPFRDFWPASDNQVGHFMTAVDMGYRPEFTYQWVPSVGGGTGAYVQAAGVHESFCIALIVGHEQVPDDANLFKIRQYFAASTNDVEKFYRAVGQVPGHTRYPASVDMYLSRTKWFLQDIPIGNGAGNSFHDLHLSLYGYAFGTFIRKSQMTLRSDAAGWIRLYLGGGDLRSGF